jgi:hypothetical protein
VLKEMNLPTGIYEGSPAEPASPARRSSPTAELGAGTADVPGPRVRLEVPDESPR